MEKGSFPLFVVHPPFRIAEGLRGAEMIREQHGDEAAARAIVDVYAEAKEQERRWQEYLAGERGLWEDRNYL